MNNIFLENFEFIVSEAEVGELCYFLLTFGLLELALTARSFGGKLMERLSFGAFYP